MSSRIRRPETVRLEISRGDWLIVKKHLTAGETRRVYRNMVRRGVDGKDEVDPVKVGSSRMSIYLVDWSITDADDQPVVIRGQSDDMIASVLDMLDMDSFAEIRDAIDQHDTAMAIEREEEKKRRDGESKSLATSP